MPSFWEALRPELLLVRQRMNKELEIKMGPVSDFLDLQLDAIPLLVLPALVILSARSFSYNHPRVICMASMVQMMFLSSSIHNQIMDDGEESLVKTQPEPQYPALVGDLVYGKVLRLLCEANCVEMLPWLAGVICDMNDAAVARLQAGKTGRLNSEFKLEYLRREYAALFGVAGRIGASLAGAEKDQIHNMTQIGMNLGMIIGICEHQLDGQFLSRYVEEARRRIALVASDWGRDLLETNLKILLGPRSQPVQTMAV